MFYFSKNKNKNEKGKQNIEEDIITLHCTLYYEYCIVFYCIVLYCIVRVYCLVCF